MNNIPLETDLKKFKVFLMMIHGHKYLFKNVSDAFSKDSFGELASFCPILVEAGVKDNQNNNRL